MLNKFFQYFNEAITPYFDFGMTVVDCCYEITNTHYLNNIYFNCIIQFFSNMFKNWSISPHNIHTTHFHYKTWSPTQSTWLVQKRFFVLIDYALLWKCNGYARMLFLVLVKKLSLRENDNRKKHRALQHPKTPIIEKIFFVFEII